MDILDKTYWIHCTGSCLSYKRQEFFGIYSLLPLQVFWTKLAPQCWVLDIYVKQYFWCVLFLHHCKLHIPFSSYVKEIIVIWRQILLYPCCYNQSDFYINFLFWHNGNSNMELRFSYLSNDILLEWCKWLYSWILGLESFKLIYNMSNFVNPNPSKWKHTLPPQTASLRAP